MTAQSISTFGGCALFVAMAGILAVQSARGADEHMPGKTVTSLSAAGAYFLQPRDVVLFLGNSITAGAQPEMDFLTEDLRKQYPNLADGNDKVKFITAGNSGEQAVGGANRLKGLLDQYKPTVCVVCYGTCEVTFKNEPSFTPAMKDIIRQLKAANVVVTVVSAPPPSAGNWHQTPWPADKFVKGVPIMVAQARKLASEEGVPFVDAFAALTTFADKNSRELTTDGIHLNKDGYRAMADALQQTWEFGKPLAKAGSPRAVPPAFAK